MLDSDALTIAAGTLPWAIEVNAIEDCTVDGTRHRNSTPVYRPGVNTDGTRARAANPRMREDDECRGQHQQMEPPVPQPVQGLGR